MQMPSEVHEPTRTPTCQPPTFVFVFPGSLIHLLPFPQQPGLSKPRLPTSTSFSVLSVLLLTKSLLIPSILSTYLFIYLLIQKIFTEYQSCTRHCYRYWECSYEQTDRNLCPYRVAVWWGVSSHAHAHTHILFRVNMGSRCSVSTY